MFALIFSTTFVWNISQFEKNLARHYCTQVFMYSSRYSCQIVTKTELSGHISKKPIVSHSMKMRPVGTELFHVGRQKNGRTLRNSMNRNCCHCLYAVRYATVYHTGLINRSETDNKLIRCATNCDVNTGWSGVVSNQVFQGYNSDFPPNISWETRLFLTGSGVYHTASKRTTAILLVTLHVLQFSSYALLRL